MKSKKGTEKAIGIIISLVIVLFVVFLIIFFISQKTGTTQEIIDACESYGGQCKMKCSGSEIQNLLISCETSYICCVNTE